MRQIMLQDIGVRLVADRSGALVWPERRLLAVADLHLEKGSALARRGALLPPYDTGATLDRLEAVLARWRPACVVSLGDAFHDPEGCRRLPPQVRQRLRRLVAAHDWLWLTGNHDPVPPADLGGRSAPTLELGGIVFRHIPQDGRPIPPDGSHQPPVEIAGHLHPSATLRRRGRRLTRPCFIADRTRLILPAFGSYTGGLSVLDDAIAALFPADFQAYLLGRDALHMVSRRQLER